MDSVKKVDDFKPGEKSWLDDFYVTGLSLDENSKLNITTTSGNSSCPSIMWTKGLIIDKE